MLANSAAAFPWQIELIVVLAAVLVAAGAAAQVIKAFPRRQPEVSEPQWQEGDPLPPPRDFVW